MTAADLCAFPLPSRSSPVPCRTTYSEPQCCAARPPPRKVPYAFVVLAFGNHQYQVCIPSPTQDRELFDARYQMAPLPTVFGVDPAKYGHPRPQPLDLTGTTPVSGHECRAALHYDRMIESVPPTG